MSHLELAVKALGVNDDWGYFPDLTITENEEIKAARDAGYCDRDFGESLEEQAQNSLAGARAYLKEKDGAE